MSTEPQLFRVHPKDRPPEKISEEDFASLGWQERDIQEWVVANPEILGDDLLIIAKEFSDFDRTKERLDLLAVDPDGKLVIIELKRDHSGADAHWQAIKYASYLRQATREQIVRMLAAHEKLSESEAVDKLTDHMESGSLENLNSDQRIILTSHRFAAEVTSAALWMNEKSRSENLITCIQITPYLDGDVLYLQSHILIPVPGTEPYTIQISAASIDEKGIEVSSSAGIKAARRRARNRDDEVTHFVRRVEARTRTMLPDELKTNSDYGYARGNRERWYSLWYEERYPWTKTQFSYIIHVCVNTDGTFRVVNNLEIYKSFLCDKLGFEDTVINDLKDHIESLFECEMQNNRSMLRARVTVAKSSAELNDELIESTADSLKTMIETLTDKVEEFVEAQTQTAHD